MFDFDDSFDLAPDPTRPPAGEDRGGTRGEVPAAATDGQEDSSGVISKAGDAVEVERPRVAIEVEIEIRAMLTLEFAAKRQGGSLGELGLLVLVNLCLATGTFALSFVDALHLAHAECREVLSGGGLQDTLWQALSVRTWWVLKFLASVSRLRFEGVVAGTFQAALDLLVGPDHSVLAWARRWHSASITTPADLTRAQQGAASALESLAACLREASSLAVDEGPMRRSSLAVSDRLGKRLLQPLADGPCEAEEDWLASTLLPSAGRLHTLHLPDQLGPTVLVELRAILLEPILPSEVAHLQLPFRKSALGVVRFNLAKRKLAVPEEDLLPPHVSFREVHHEKFWVDSLRRGCRKLDEPVPRLRPPSGVILTRSLSFAIGEKVFAFYDTNDHPHGCRYATVKRWPTAFPLVGVTCGWLPATVLGPIEPDDSVLEGFGRVRVQFDADFCDPFGLNWLLRRPAKDKQNFDPREMLASLGTMVDVRFQHTGQRRRLASTYCRGMELTVPVGLIRQGPPVEPLLTILCFRWYDYWSDPGPSDYVVTSDGMLLDLLSGPRSPRRQLPGDYKVVTVFVKETEDLERLDLSELKTLLRGENTIAWYLLWPVVVGKGGRDAGSVGERQFFALCQRLERWGLRSGWPHTSHLYRLLCGKLWIPQMCLNRRFRVPPTTRVHYAEFEQRPEETAQRALRHLMHLRALLWGKDAMALEEFRGVAKLGFSWCGGDVLPFQGLDGLVKSLKQLFGQPQCEQTVCLVQERIMKVVGEYRVVCVYDRRQGRFHKEPIWVFNCPRDRQHTHSSDVTDFTVASATAVPRAAVARMLFRGDAAAQLSAEKQALDLVDQWLLWYQTESPEPPQTTRLDFLAVYDPGVGSEVWTCEVGECGASLCSMEVHGRNTAAVNFAVQRDPDGHFPTLLPKTMPRNYGWKS